MFDAFCMVKMVKFISVILCGKVAMQLIILRNDNFSVKFFFKFYFPLFLFLEFSYTMQLGKP